MSVFTITDENKNLVGWARNLVDAIGTKEHLERCGHKNLALRRVHDYDAEYKEIMAKIFQ